jgi:O-antigen ligase
VPDPWNQLRRAASRLAFALLVVLVLWLPLPYGSVTPWGRMALEAGAFAALALAAASSAPAGPLKPAATAITALCLLLALGLFQILPLPGKVLEAVSPASAAIQSQAGRLLALHGEAARPRAAISIAPIETESWLLETAALLALFAASAIVNVGRRRRALFAAALCAAALFQVGWGLFGDPAISGEAGRLRGTFVNPDHLAGYLEIGMAAAFALLYAEILTGGDRGGGEHLSEKVETRFLPLALLGLLWAALCSGVLLSQSRGGVIAAVAGTATLVVLALWRRRGGALGSALLLAGAATIAVAFAAAPIAERFLASDPRDVSSDTRAQLRAASARAGRRFPLLGGGLGAFQEAFALSQPRELLMLVDHAHDDWVEIRTTGGWIGFLLALAAVAATFAGLLGAWRRQRHRVESAFALAGLGAMAALSVHAFVEFNFAIPAIPATLAMLLGWSFAAAAFPGGSPAPA